MASHALVWFGGPGDAESHDTPRIRRLRILAEGEPHAQREHGDIRDHAWIAAIRRGDEPAFHSLYSAYAASLWEFTAYLLRDPDTAGDIVQDVFASIWERRMALEIHENVRVYLFRAVRNQVGKRLRHAAVVRRMEATVAGETVAMGRLSDDPLSGLDTQALEHAVDALVQAMPATRRTAATLRLRHGLDDGETAAVMGISVEAVRMHVMRARAMLRPLVERFRRE